jgi:hypothetical protein
MKKKKKITPKKKVITKKKQFEKHKLMIAKAMLKYLKKRDPSGEYTAVIH